MDDLTYSIQKQTRKNENQTSTWLKQNGISPEHFAETKIYLLQAQKVATNLLKNHAKLLEQNQAHTLNNYLQAMTNEKKRNMNRYQYSRHFPTSLGTAVQILPEKVHCYNYVA